ncbi:MAG: ACP S-malonyltransferase [Methylococcales bacterium]
MKESYSNLAFVFPGQGSQSVGMLSDIAQNYPEVKEVFQCASDILDIDLWRLTVEGPEQTLNLTENTQPAMLAAGVAMWKVWCRNSDVRPGWMAGHSLGEYSALVCSGALTFEDAIKLVAKRANFMQEAVPAGIGAMAAILGLDEPAVVSICAKITGDESVSPANFNAPGQIVIAGHRLAVERAVELASEEGAKRAIILPVSVPSHCILMESAAGQLDEYLQKTPIEPPTISIIHNSDVASHVSPEVIRSVLKDQLTHPVRWIDSIKFMSEQGVDGFIECGPGRVLSGLNKRIAKGCKAIPLFNCESLDKALELVQ